MFWQNFTRLCAQAGKPPSRVVEEMGLKKASVTGWKRGVVPRDSTLARIAYYFGVPVESLTAEEPPTMTAFPAATPTPSPAPFAAGESELLDYYRHFTREGQGRLLDFAESMKRSGMYEPGVDYFLKGFNSEGY